jgi:hypothetical protein
MRRPYGGVALISCGQHQRGSINEEVIMARAPRPVATFFTAMLAICVAGSATGASLLGSSGSAAPRRAELTMSAECPPFPGADAFVERITNRYLPLIPGAIYSYKGLEDDEVFRTVVEVTHETKSILGVQTVVVRDTVRDDRGRLIEQTLDWFAQDTSGNVWYFGEDSKDYENGQVVSTEGSWEAGVDGAQPGIVMLGQPQVGAAYQQECAPGVAEDAAEVLGFKGSAKTPYGKFGHALRTRETNPLEPGVAEEKLYAPCVGMVRAFTVRGGKEEESLVDVKNGPSRTELGCKSKRHDKNKGKGKGDDKDKGKDRRKHDRGKKRHRVH